MELGWQSLLREECMCLHTEFGNVSFIDKSWGSGLERSRLMLIMLYIADNEYKETARPKPRWIGTWVKSTAADGKASTLISWKRFAVWAKHVDWDESCSEMSHFILDIQGFGHYDAISKMSSTSYKTPKYPTKRRWCATDMLPMCDLTAFRFFPLPSQFALFPLVFPIFLRVSRGLVLFKP